MEVSLRRLQTGDIDQVIEIEREAFSPLWITTPFKRELNNQYACYLVACEPEEPEEEDSTGADSKENRSLWSRVVTGAQRLVPGKDEENNLQTPIAGYVSVWYQGEEAHITEIAVRETRRGNGIGELLLIGSLREAVKYGSKVMTLEARVSNFMRAFLQGSLKDPQHGQSKKARSMRWSNESGLGLDRCICRLCR